MYLCICEVVVMLSLCVRVCARHCVVQCQCDMVNSASDALAGYAAVSNLLNNAAPGPEQCLDVSYTDMIAELQNVSLTAPAAGGGTLLFLAVM